MRAFILIVVLMLSTFIRTYSQESPTKLNISTIKTELKEQAISLGFEYIKSLDSLFQSNDIFVAKNNSLFQLSPEFDVQTGTQDAFSSITAKLSGIFMTFKDTVIAEGIRTPNSSRGFQTFPISAGLETNDKFSFVNGIVEIGWVPWYQTVGNNRTPEFLKHTRIGVFLQGGYKFAIDTSAINQMGGEIDESAEELGNALFRLKGSFGIDTKSLFRLSGVGFGIIGNSHGWYDVINNEVYYSLEGILRFYLSSKNDKAFDFIYQKGSGAPNFNQGDQFGVGMTIMF